MHSACAVIFLVILDASGIFCFSINYDYFGRQKREVEKVCDGGFKCSISGECLPIDMRCDGLVNCKDGSDEFDDCKTAVHCPGFTYVCDYGACVDGDAKCNGQKDCRDNSDEINCFNATSDTTNNHSKDPNNCMSNQFRCLSGECISQIDKCDGVPNCQDESDESRETCLNKYCPGWTFKCNYGACVDGNAKCNGLQDCFDKSDEKDCEPEKVTKPPKPTEPTEPTEPERGCLLPSHPAKGKWEVQGNNIGWEPGKKVAMNSILLFTCEHGHKLMGAKYTFCLSQGWSEQPPTCKVLCPSLYTTSVMTVNCHNSDGSETRCDDATDGATATYECAPFYESSEKIIQTRICIDGYWNLPVPRCIPVCGEKKVSAEPLIVKGQNVIKGNYPWVAAIFRKFGVAFENVCGGSMLSQHVIMTAAHCVSNQHGDIISVDLVKVAVGKYYNRYEDVRDHQVQYSNVNKILLHSKYRGDSRRYQSDIAFLITTDLLLLSKVVQPVCYSNLNHIHLQNGDEGIVTGWGFTTSNSQPSDELKEISVPYKDDITCTRELPRDWADKYYVIDKFCAGHINRSTAVCKGDSGGGLVFKNPKDDRFYVHGIVSVSKTTTNIGCDVEVSALYTQVALYYDWLEQVVSRYSS